MTITTITKLSDIGLNQVLPQEKQGLFLIKLEGAEMKREEKNCLKEEEYDPFEHVEAKHPTTYLETLVHFFKGTVGTGILSLPAAFAQSGYAVGVLGIIFTTYSTTYCAYILARSEVELCRRRKVPALSYQATTEAAFKDGPKPLKSMAFFALHFCNLLLLISQISSACAYLIFIAANIKAVTDVYFMVIDMRMMMFICTVPLLLVTCIRRLKYLAPFSTIGSITVLVSCGVVFYFMFQNIPPISSRRAIGPIGQIPQFFGTVFFATGCISLILPLQNEMKKPKLFTSRMGVLNVGAVIVVTLYITFGFFGYLKFGDDAAGSVTLNLPPDHISAHVVQVLLSVATLFGTTLAYYVAVTIIMENYLGPLVMSTHLVFWEYMVRLTLVAVTLLLSELVPNLELVVSLSGVLSHCTLATTLPCVIHILTNHKKGNTFPKFLLYFGQDVIIIILTTFVFITGLAANIVRIIQLYDEPLMGSNSNIPRNLSEVTSGDDFY